MLLFVFYFGCQMIIVGDDEQVMFIVVGMQFDDVSKFVSIFFDGVLYKEFYDGEIFVYEFVQIVFGGVICFIEYFCCVFDIIVFSNYFFYKGEIQVLCEVFVVLLCFYVVFFYVFGGCVCVGEVNDVEVEIIVLFICVVYELLEFVKNDCGVFMFFGVVFFVGDK